MDRILLETGKRLLMALAATVLVAAWTGGGALALSVLVGGLWHTASLWSLSRLLHAWLGPQPSKRRVIGWLLVKFPALYAAAFALLTRQTISCLGFGIGFTVVLVTAIGCVALQASPFMVSPPHGR